MILLAQLPLNYPLVLSVRCHVFQCVVNVTEINNSNINTQISGETSSRITYRINKCGLVLTLLQCCCC